MWANGVWLQAHYYTDRLIIGMDLYLELEVEVEVHRAMGRRPLSFRMAFGSFITECIYH